jgi:hypothetical protein
MRKVILSAMLLFSLSAFASDAVVSDKKVDCDAISKTGDQALIAQSGCCSYHNGVSGCSGGRVTCNDGTTSPSCTCNSIVPLENTVGAKL